jgi:DNA-directed RNA polymerase III subunit RPC4
MSSEGSSTKAGQSAGASSNPNVSGSGDAGPSQSTSRPSSPSKAIGSLAKKQADVTRQGTQKLKFVPTIPSRRKKECVDRLTYRNGHLIYDI